MTWISTDDIGHNPRTIAFKIRQTARCRVLSKQPMDKLCRRLVCSCRRQAQLGRRWVLSSLDLSGSVFIHSFMALSSFLIIMMDQQSRAFPELFDAVWDAFQSGLTSSGMIEMNFVSYH
uniref:Uncharacterized protein n=1 Tax=Steinernema glaseri TaxID=37863 RepID=A0A1I7ZP76_9BILA